MVADGLSIINADFSSTSFRVSSASIGAAQLPRQQHRLPTRRPGPATTACSRRRSWSRSTARSARASACSARRRFEIPRSVERDTRFDHLRDRATSCAAGSPPRTGTTCAPWGCSCSCGGCTLLLLTLARAGRRRPVRRRSATSACAPALRARSHRVQRRLLRAGRAVRRRGSGRCSRGSARSTTRTSGGTSGSGRCPTRTSASSTAPRSRTWSGGCWASGSAGGSSTTAATSPSGRWSPSATTARSTRAARSSATRRRTAPSSPTAARIGAGCTLGVGAFVHYGVTMGDGAVLAADSFLMKGEEVPPHARWGGNPAGSFAAQATPSRAAGGRTPMHHGVTDDRPTSTGAACSSPAVHRDPALDARPGAGHRRARDASDASRRRCAGWRTSWRCHSARCCWPHTPRCSPRCPVSRGRHRLRGRDGRPAAAVPADDRRRLVAGAAAGRRAGRDRAAGAPGLPGRRARSRAGLTDRRSRPCSTRPARPSSPRTPCCGWASSTDGDAPVLRLRYRTEVLDADSAARIAGYHLTALALIAADPDAEHGRQSLLSAEELRFQLDGLAGPRRELPDRRFHELFEERVRRAPGRRRRRARRPAVDLPGAQRPRQPAGPGAAGARAAPRGRRRGGDRAQPGLDGRRPRDLQGRRRVPADRAALPGRPHRHDARPRRLPAGADRARQHRHAGPGARLACPEVQTLLVDDGLRGGPRRRRPRRRASRRTSSPTSTSPPAPPASPRARCASTRACSTTSTPRSTTWGSARGRWSPRPRPSASTSRCGSWSPRCWSAGGPCSSSRT